MNVSTGKDIRWHQRFSNFRRALKQFNRAIDLAEERKLTELEGQGLIQSFEYTHELAWKTLKDFIEFQGNTKIYGSKDATREAFKLGLIDNGDTWMEMIKSRNETSHTYNEDVAEEIVFKIRDQYHQLFLALELKLEELRSGEQGSLLNEQ